MRKLIPAVLATAILAAGASPAAAGDPPPTDPVTIEGGGGCGGEACTPEPYSVEVDKTYPKRLAAWATDLLP